jgi:integrase
MPNLTKRIIDAAAPMEREYLVWDARLPGFGLRVFPSGRKSYLFQYRHSGRTRRIAIGGHGEITPDQAFKRAMKLRSETFEGRDPSAERRQLGKQATVSELCALYLEKGCEGKKPSTLATDRGRIERHIKPLLGHLTVGSVTRLDVERFMSAVTTGKTAAKVKTKKRGLARVQGGAGTAARTLGLLGAIFSFAQREELRADNPARNVHRAKDGKRERFLSDQDLGQLGQAMARVGPELNPNVVPVLKLLLLTGCRKGEILGLTWSEVDLPQRTLRLRDSKTGARKVPLNEQAIAILKSQPRLRGNDFVFPATSGTGHFTALQDGWNRIRTAAGIPDVHVHDLRHSFATVLASSGNSLHVIGSLLGHRDLRTTQVYAHLVEDTLRLASQDAASRIWTTLELKK